MKKEQQILNKLAKYNEVQKVELSAEPMKVELSIIDDLINEYKQTAARALPAKRQIAQAADELKFVANQLNKISEKLVDVKKQADELGANDASSKASAVSDAAKSLASSWSKAAEQAESAAKRI
jgi:uncharacterized phage infection (PIP) family protein YhgE